jgi:hypothetical protein
VGGYAPEYADRNLTMPEYQKYDDFVIVTWQSNEYKDILYLIGEK